MVDAAIEGDVEKIKAEFVKAADKEVMYWHVTRALKEAIKHQHLWVIDFIIEDMDTPLNHEAFRGYLHNFLFSCSLAEMRKDQLAIEFNQQILRYLVKGYGKGNCDEMDKANGSTPLIIACEHLCDLTIVEILVD